MALVSLFPIVKYFSDEPSAVKKGENAVNSGHILEVDCDWKIGILAGKVQASMKDKTYSVKIAFKSDGDVETATCDCPRGQFKCHHMAAIMVFAHRNISCTDGPCQYKGKKKSTDRGIVTTVSKMFPTSKPDYNAESADDNAMQEFLDELKTMHLNTGFEWMHSPEAGVPCMAIPTFHEIFRREALLTTENLQMKLLQAMTLTEEQTGQVAVLTIGQRTNPNWLMYRKGRLTSSNFGDVLGAIRRNTYSPSLFKTLLGEYGSLEGVKSIQWGIDHEDIAAANFKECNREVELKMQPCGLYLDQSGMLGASPDRLLNDDGLLEVKCPYTQRETGVRSAFGKKGFPIIPDDKGRYQINQTHKYYHQIQGQLYLTGRQYCILYVWSKVDNAAVTIRRDPNWVDNLEKLRTFYRTQLLPKLVDISTRSVV